MTKHLALILLLTIPVQVHAAKKDKKDLPTAAEPAPVMTTGPVPVDGPVTGDGMGDAERVNVDRIKEKYWARGDESEIGVVQNRLYSKSRKIELGLFGGLLSSDPFLSVAAIGASAGFHFNEYLAVHAFAWKDAVSRSTALEVLEKGGKKANTNPPKVFYGAEASASLLYGKLSVVGKAIIYYDFHLLGGAGITSTESGSYLTPFIGIGQQVYLNQSLSLRVDYRHMRYTEDIKEKEITPLLGTVVGQRTNFTGAVTLGLTILFGK